MGTAGVHDRDENPDLADSVEALLDWLSTRCAALPAEEQSEFTASILLNALLSVLEEVRRTQPDRYRAYVRMSVTLLDDD